MQMRDLEGMSIDELWTLHKRVSKVLFARLVFARGELEQRLAYLDRSVSGPMPGSEAMSRDNTGRPRRKYPRVVPKYRNPAPPHETWSGRGKEPRWFREARKAGRKIEDFRIDAAEQARRTGFARRAKTARNRS